MSRRRALVICPGRGTYNRDELGYLARHHPAKRDLLAMVDGYRARLGKPTVSGLDGARRFSAATHVRGDNASPLIYTCAYADFLDIDRDGFDVVAVTGKIWAVHQCEWIEGNSGETIMLSDPTRKPIGSIQAGDTVGPRT